MSKNTNELKTRAPGRFGLAVSRLGSSAVGRFLVYGRDSRFGTGRGRVFGREQHQGWLPPTLNADSEYSTSATG